MDPFIAQQIARFHYLHLKQWMEAEEYAKIATEIKPGNASFWNTYGQVFNEQLKIGAEEAKGVCRFEDSTAQKMISLALRAVYCFKREQTERKWEISTRDIFSGQFGELEAQIRLLKVLENCQCFKNQDNLIRFLRDNEFSMPSLAFLEVQEVNFLKNMKENYQTPMRTLDEQFLEVKFDALMPITPYSRNFQMERDRLFKLMVDFQEFFGETAATCPRNLNEEDACSFRWKIAVKKGAMSLNFLLYGRKGKTLNDDHIEKLNSIYDLMRPNMDSIFCKFEYLLAMLNTLTVLMIDKSKPLKHFHYLSFEKVLSWSTSLYEEEQSNVTWLYLEPFMYFVMFNFPSEKRKKHKICPVTKLDEACQRWWEAFKQKHKNSENESPILKHERTLFFAGKGEPLDDIVYSGSLPMNRSDSLRWNTPGMKNRLELFSGVVDRTGNWVHLVTQEEELSFKVRCASRAGSDFREKPADFYIGFTFSGPKAFILQGPLVAEEEDWGEAEADLHHRRGHDCSPSARSDAVSHWRN